MPDAMVISQIALVIDTARAKKLRTRFQEQESVVLAEPRLCSVEPGEAWGSEVGVLFEPGRSSSNDVIH